MKRAVAALLVVLGGACAAPSSAVRWEDAAPAATEATATEAAPVAAPDLAPLPPPAVSPAGRGAGPIDVDGRQVEDGASLDMPGLELACLPAADALTTPLVARARYDDTAGRLNLPVGRLAFIVLARDPARSITDPPPLFCRAIPTASFIKAPFVRVHEPARAWMFRRIAHGLVDDAASLVAASAAHSLVPAAQPRVLVGDDGALLAVALPVASSAGPGQH